MERKNQGTRISTSPSGDGRAYLLLHSRCRKVVSTVIRCGGINCSEESYDRQGRPQKTRRDEYYSHRTPRRHRKRKVISKERRDVLSCIPMFRILKIDARSGVEHTTEISTMRWWSGLSQQDTPPKGVPRSSSIQDPYWRV